MAYRPMLLWLLPTARIEAEWSTVLEALRHVGLGRLREALHPSFAPHITIGSGYLEAEPRAAGAALESLARQLPPIALAAAGTVRAPEPDEEGFTIWQSLVFEFLPQASLHALARAADAALGWGGSEARTQRPHVSLHYSRLGMAQKVHLLERASPRHLPARWPRVLFDRLRLVGDDPEIDDPAPRIATWQHVAEARLVGTERE